MTEIEDKRAAINRFYAKHSELLHKIYTALGFIVDDLERERNDKPTGGDRSGESVSGIGDGLDGVQTRRNRLGECIAIFKSMQESPPTMQDLRTLESLPDIMLGIYRDTQLVGAGKQRDRSAYDYNVAWHAGIHSALSQQASRDICTDVIKLAAACSEDNACALGKDHWHIERADQWVYYGDPELAPREGYFDHNLRALIIAMAGQGEGFTGREGARGVIPFGPNRSRQPPSRP